MKKEEKRVKIPIITNQVRTPSLNAAKNQINLVQAEGYNIVIGDVTGSNMVVTPTDPDDTAGTAVTALTGGNDSTAVLGTVRLSSDKTFTVTPGNAANIFSGATAALSSTLTQLGDITLKTVLNIDFACSI